VRPQECDLFNVELRFAYFLETDQPVTVIHRRLIFARLPPKQASRCNPQREGYI